MKAKDFHPLYPDLVSDFQKGKMDRREFLRYSSLLGVGMTAAATLGGFSLAKPAQAAGTPKRGGTMVLSSQVMKITHPAQFSWLMPSNMMRQVAEYVTFTDGDNVSHPYLAESWSASDDLKTWTFKLRQGVKFNNGDDFSADDVIFTMNQWLNKDVKSSMLGLLSGYLDPSGIEKADDHTVVLHLKRAEIAVPEHLYQYPALILNHKTFQGDFLKAPHGTGPFTIETYKEGEMALLKARKDYWQKGADGQPLPYLDGIKFIDMGGELAPQIAALKSGEIMLIEASDNPGPQIMKAVKGDKAITIYPVTTATTRVLRMRVDAKPFDNVKVRNALKMCQNREKILALAFMGEGMEGQDVHVCPKHPDYCEKPIPKYDPEGAKKLLAEAGYPDGIDMQIAVGSEWTDVVRYAEILKEDAAPAGIRLQIQTMPTSQYWEKWTEVPLGITPWTHRPLGTMVLALAYTADDSGKPVPWNETRWVDDEFVKLLNEASATLDIDKRRQIMCKLEDIQMERGPIGISYWMNTWMCVNDKVKNVKPHPNLLLLLNDVYLEG